MPLSRWSRHNGGCNGKPAEAGPRKDRHPMKRTLFTRSLLAAAGLALAFATLPITAQPGNAVPRGNCYLNSVLPGSDAPPTSALTEAEKTALNGAIEDEYKARATYNKILDTFGEVMPFAHIVNAEGRHVEALAYLHTRYGVAIPEDTWAEKIPTYATLKEAAEASVQAEVDNGALYDGLMKDVTNVEVTNVFKALQFATMEHHLPAFQRLLDRQNGVVTGMGNGMGNGMGRGMGNGMGNGMGRGMGRGCGAGGCCAVGATPGPGRGMGLGGQSMRGRGNNWAPGQGKGLGAGRGNATGRGQGYGLGRGNGTGLGQGYGMGRGAGRGFNPNPPANCPRIN